MPSPPSFDRSAHGPPATSLSTRPALPAPRMGGATALGSIVGSAILAQPANAADVTLFVSPTGSDTNNCQTIGSPCATLGYALSQAAASDTIMVAAGTYHVGCVLHGPASLAGTTGSPTIIQRRRCRGNTIYQRAPPMASWSTPTT